MLDLWQPCINMSDSLSIWCCTTFTCWELEIAQKRSLLDSQIPTAKSSFEALSSSSSKYSTWGLAGEVKEWSTADSQCFEIKVGIFSRLGYAWSSSHLPESSSLSPDQRWIGRWASIPPHLLTKFGYIEYHSVHDAGKVTIFLSQCMWHYVCEHTYILVYMYLNVIVLRELFQPVYIILEGSGSVCRLKEGGICSWKVL